MDVVVGGAKEFAGQNVMLLYKTLIQWSRRWITMLVRLLLPVVLVICMWLTVEMPSSTSTGTGDGKLIGGIPKCTTCRDITCVTLRYSPNDDVDIYNIMSQVATNNDPPLTIAPFLAVDQKGYDVVAMANGWALQIFLGNPNNTNATQAGVVFDVPRDWASFPTGVLSTSPEYMLFLPDEYWDPYLVRYTQDLDIQQPLQVALDRAILSTYSGKNVDLQVTAYDVYGGDPYDEYSSEELLDAFMIPLYMYTIVTVDSLAITSVINSDRSSNVILGLKMMGLQSAPYWISTFLINAIFAIIPSITAIVTGIICGLQFFTSCSFMVLFFLLWLGYMCSTTYTLWLSAWIHHPTANMSLLVCSYLAGLLFVLLDVFLPFFGLDESSNAIWAFNWPLSFAEVTKYVFYLTTDTVNGTVRGFHWSDLYVNTTALMPNSDYYYPNPITLSDNLLFLMMTTFLALWFAWYFDVVWPGKYGVPQRLIFFFLPRYWGFGGAPEPIVEVDKFDASKLTSVMESLDQDVQREYKQTMKLAKDDDPDTLLRVLKICKVFKKGRTSSGQDCRALDYVTFSGTRGTILGVLGHNGAGKTTTINLLTGVYAPTYGDGFICGKSIITEMTSIQKRIGVCPQHDIVWPDLTARQHLNVFCLLKRVPLKQLKGSVESALASVQLTEFADRRVETFSGGMKRRLSVAISAIGNPDVIFMDEPTKGLDPSNKRELWNAIETMKVNKLIVLTTHSMSEAEALADKILILALGRLRAVGSSAHLKKRYGAGYNINVVAEDTTAVRNGILQIAPGVKVLAETSGNLSVGLGTTASKTTVNVLRYLEECASSGKLKDWGLSETTMEQVFLRITHGEYLSTDDAELDDENIKVKLAVIVDGEPDPRGLIQVTRATSLLDTRAIIEQNIPDISPEYNFVYNGAIITSQQEADMMAADFTPNLVITSKMQTPVPSSSASAAVIDLQKRLDQVTTERDALAHEVWQLRAALQAMKGGPSAVPQLPHLP
ncbi:ABC transporter A family protein [Pelomyxa schiedti]|nr:ABC transporter A family protein [Pelomyxa schiedti]